MTKEPVTIDFETEGIEHRPIYPPAPVGVAIRSPDGQSRYMAWGHPEGNNCSVGEARRALQSESRNAPVLCHNGAFDMDVWTTHMNLPMPAKREDTLFLAFLDDPYAATLALKPQAQTHLGIIPKERDKMVAWLVEHIPEVHKKPKLAGQYICKAPGDIVGRYAVGDVKMTHALNEYLKPIVYEAGMGPAYERELALMPLTLEMERSGLRVDVRRLKKLARAMEQLDTDIRKEVNGRLHITPNATFNMSSGPQLAAALVNAGKLDTIFKTKTGRTSTKMANLHAGCNDKRLLNMLAVHSVVEKYLSSFIRPWIEQAEKTGGRILPTFNQVRNRGTEGGGGGARTGRMSSSDPNMQNIGANVLDSVNKDTLLLLQKWLADGYGIKFIGLRDYLLPDEGMLICCVDYNQQELRIFAHFEEDSLAAEYRRNPALDVHTYIQQLIKQILGIEFPRKHIKITVFGILYGMGLDKLAARLEVDRATAKKVRDGIHLAIPGIRRQMKELEYLARRDEPLVTWGGRRYLCEEPTFNEEKGEWWSYEYKLLNYRIQASAADITKQGMLNVHQAIPDIRIAVQVHDELVCMVPDRSYGKRIAEAMCDVKLNVPMLAEPKYSTKSWARAK